MSKQEIQLTKYFLYHFSQGKWNHKPLFLQSIEVPYFKTIFKEKKSAQVHKYDSYSKYVYA